MRRNRRIAAIERGLGGPLRVSRAQRDAAGERLRLVLDANLLAMAQRRPEPAYDRAQVAADAAVINQWRRQVGLGPGDKKAMEATLLAHIRTLANDPEWTWHAT